MSRGSGNIIRARPNVYRYDEIVYFQSRSAPIGNNHDSVQVKVMTQATHSGTRLCIYRGNEESTSVNW